MKSTTVHLFQTIVLTQALTALGLFKPLKEYSGQEFFSDWDFYGRIDDTTWGNVTYVTRDVGAQQKLAFVDASTGHAIVRVDNTTNIEQAPSVNRNSVKITSKDAYPIGSLIVMDAIHIPYGCSVWPAFWTIGTELAWPHAGEIDLIEGVNGMKANSMVMHTDPGCTQPPNVKQGGKTLDTDCGTAVGCKVEETKPNSYGEGFANAGGGVFAAQIDVSGIYIWFWGRSDIPASLSSSKPDTSIDIADWGTPSAAYPAAGCDIEKLFKPQKLVLDITLCGQWAGIPEIYSATCPGQCISNVFGDGSNYATAYWEISHIRTFTATDAESPPNNTPSTVGSASTPLSSSASSTSINISTSVSSGTITNSTSVSVPAGSTAATFLGTLTVPDTVQPTSTGVETAGSEASTDSPASQSSSAQGRYSLTTTLFSMTLACFLVLLSQ